MRITFHSFKKQTLVGQGEWADSFWFGPTAIETAAAKVNFEDYLIV